MIRHTMVFCIKPNLSQQIIDNAFTQLFNLKTKLPGIHKVTGGACHFYNNVGSRYTITHGFSIDFDNQDDYSKFVNDPITHPAKECMAKIAVNGINGFFGFDINNEAHTYPSPLDNRRVPRLQLRPRHL